MKEYNNRRDKPLVNPGFTIEEYEKQREEDESNDLFTVLNRAQEVVMRGGEQTRNASGNVRRMRSVKSIDKEVELNRKLFDLAVKYAA